MKKILYILLGIFALFIILAFLGPREVKVERSIIVNRPTEYVKEKLGDFNYFHNNWNPWTAKDPAMTTTYTGVPGQPGHHYSWRGNDEVGYGYMELAGYNGDTILQRFQFENHGETKAYFILKDKGDATDVTWGMHWDVGFFGRPAMMFMNMDKYLGKDYENGLLNLKKKMESETTEAKSAYKIDELNWEEKLFVSTKPETMPGAQCGKHLAMNLPKIYADMEKNHLVSPMAPCMIFYSWDEKTSQTNCAAAICAPHVKVTGLKGWEKCILPASKVLKIAYYGDYDKSYDAHMSMDRYMKEKEMKQEVVIEEYVTDPTKEHDTSKWLTNIYYVLKNKN